MKPNNSDHGYANACKHPDGEYNGQHWGDGLSDEWWLRMSDEQCRALESALLANQDREAA